MSILNTPDSLKLFQKYNQYLLLAPTATNQNPFTTPDTTCNGRNSPGGTSGEIKI